MRTLLPAALLAGLGTASFAQEASAPPRPPASPNASRTAVEVSSGVEYEEGSYGTGQKIRRMSVPNTVRVAKGRLQVTATLPYTRIDGPVNVVSGGGLLGLPIIVDPTRPPGARTRKQGIGDLTLAASYGVPSAVVDVTLSGKVKVPTAAKNLGTGKTDYAVQAQVSKKLGALIPFASVGYTIPGDPDGYKLRNGLAFNGGVAAALGNKALGYVSYGQSQSLSEQLPDERKVTGGIDSALSDKLSLGLYGAAGLSKGAPDVGAGIRLGIRLD